jgi:hypothetical protein
MKILFEDSQYSNYIKRRNEIERRLKEASKDPKVKNRQKARKKLYNKIIDKSYNSKGIIDKNEKRLNNLQDKLSKENVRARRKEAITKYVKRQEEASKKAKDILTKTKKQNIINKSKPADVKSTTSNLVKKNQLATIKKPDINDNVKKQNINNLKNKVSKKLSRNKKIAIGTGATLAAAGAIYGGKKYLDKNKNLEKSK